MKSALAWVSAAWRWGVSKVRGYPALLQENTALREKVRDQEAAIDSLQRRMRVLEAAQAQERAFAYRNGVYWDDDPNAVDPGPFCPNCWNAEKLKIHPRAVVGAHWCSRCSSRLHDPDAPTPKEQPRRPRGGSDWVHGWRKW